MQLCHNRINSLGPPSAKLAASQHTNHKRFVQRVADVYRYVTRVCQAKANGLDNPQVALDQIPSLCCHVSTSDREIHIAAADTQNSATTLELQLSQRRDQMHTLASPCCSVSTLRLLRLH